MRVYFSKKMVADQCKRPSPSASKPQRVIDDWIAQGLDLDIRQPSRATPETIKQSHDKRYVDGVLAGRIANGFGDRGQDVIDSLPYTVGAMTDAAIHALKSGSNAVALVSGFHHACYDCGGSFCTFNGLIVAAFESRKSGAAKVGILDLDQHYGNGTANIIDHLGIDWIKHISSGKLFHQPSQAGQLLRGLGDWVKSFEGCDVLLVQLGADQYSGDPLGGVLDLDQLRQRDRIVFETADAMRLPIAWCLAGGYSDDNTVVKIHRATAEECIAVEGHREGKKSAR